MISYCVLQDRLDYDPSTGVFTWKAIPNPIHREKIWNKRFAGTRAGSTDKAGYTRIKIHGSSESAHRLAWLWVTGKEPSDEIDHRDGDRSNNRFDNLREATRSQNCQNRVPLPKGASDHCGVYFHKRNNRWIGQINADKVRHYLGSFKTEEAANAAVRAARARLHGEFARAA